jgi:hypothetical protein
LELLEDVVGLDGVAVGEGVVGFPLVGEKLVEHFVFDHWFEA